MVESLGYALLAGLGMAAICKKARLPRIVGMLAVGLPCGKLVERSDKNERKGTDEGEDAGTRPSHRATAFKNQPQRIRRKVSGSRQAQ